MDSSPHERAAGSGPGGTTHVWPGGEAGFLPVKADGGAGRRQPRFAEGSSPKRACSFHCGTVGAGSHLSLYRLEGRPLGGTEDIARPGTVAGHCLLHPKLSHHLHQTLRPHETLTPVTPAPGAPAPASVCVDLPADVFKMQQLFPGSKSDLNLGAVGAAPPPGATGSEFINHHVAWFCERPWALPLGRE